MKRHQSFWIPVALLLASGVCFGQSASLPDSKVSDSVPRVPRASYKEMKPIMDVLKQGNLFFVEQKTDDNVQQILSRKNAMSRSVRHLETQAATRKGLEGPASPEALERPPLQKPRAY